MERKTHPRPQFIRDHWRSLDGEWQFKFDDENKGMTEKWYTGLSDTRSILVPFTYETEKSGIHESEHHSTVWYETNIEIEEVADYTLTFEGVDYKTAVWINGQMVGTHQGAYERFSFDIKSYITTGNNKIVVRVTDSMACEQPRGKQRWLKDNFGCWYVQTTGIWKTVWLEKRLHGTHLSQVKMTPNLDQDQLILEPQVSSLSSQLVTFEAEISFNGQLVNKLTSTLSHEMIPLQMDTRLKEDACWGTKVWSPEEPNLYDISFKLYQGDKLIDAVSSYFGMRKISIEKGQILLNNHQLYQRLILDQGYWQESGITPPSVEALELDLQRIKEMGYNGLRKHQKIEDERFLYLCDKEGMLVWSEMASTYTFNDLAVENFTDEWKQIVKQQYNHPAIITWVPFNESWGIKGIAQDTKQQKFTESIYYLTKALDDTRPVITNDGWVHTISDIITLHDYEEVGEVFAARYADKDAILGNEIQFNKDFYAFAEGYQYKGQPVIISEFGGIAFTSNHAEDWGYGRQVKSEDEFMERFDHIHQAIQELPYVVGYCYTQLTDVEQEVNGLLDVHREPKVDLANVKKINERRLK